MLVQLVQINEEVHGCACDKCGLPVPAWNDAVEVEIRLPAGNKTTLFLFAQSRHFLPVRDSDGKQLCEGSPSRAQYIAGQPKDSRGQYPYKQECEKPWREAFEEIQKEVPAKFKEV